MSKCPHCGEQLHPSTTPRAAKAQQLSAFYQEEFTNRKILSLPNPAWELAVVCRLALLKELTSKSISRGDRVGSLLKHFHAYAEGLKPYGPKSRKPGQHHSWIITKYGLDIERLVEREYKLLVRKENDSLVR